MNIFGYQHVDFQEKLILVEVVRSQYSFTIIGLHNTRRLVLLKSLQAIFGQLPQATIKLPQEADPNQILCAISLAIHCSQKGVFDTWDTNVLVHANINLNQSLAAATGSSHLEQLCLDTNIDVILTSSKSVQLPNIETLYADTLGSALSQLWRFALIHPQSQKESKAASEMLRSDPFATILGLEKAKQALLYAVGGKLPILLYGPPGAGKSLLLSTIQFLLPPLTDSEELEVHRIWTREKHKAPVLSVSPLMQSQDLVRGRPPWISYAHGGALLVDDLSIQKPKVRSSLSSLLDRTEFNSYPLSFLLCCASNACSCSNLGSTLGNCSCSRQQIYRYWKRLGPPLLDRFAIALVQEPENLLVSNLHETNWDYSRIAKVRAIQSRRSYQDILKLIPLYNKTTKIKTMSIRRAILCCKLARTIADFSGLDDVTADCMQKACSLYQLPVDNIT